MYTGGYFFRGHSVVCFDPERWYPLPGNPFSGAQNTRGGKILRFSTEIAVFLGNGTRSVHIVAMGH